MPCLVPVAESRFIEMKGAVPPGFNIRGGKAKGCAPDITISEVPRGQSTFCNRDYSGFSALYEGVEQTGMVAVNDARRDFLRGARRREVGPCA